MSDVMVLAEHGRNYGAGPAHCSLLMSLRGAIRICAVVLERALEERRAHHGGYHAYRSRSFPGRSGFRSHSMQRRVSPAAHPVGRTDLWRPAGRSVLEVAGHSHRMPVAPVHGLPGLPVGRLIAIRLKSGWPSNETGLEFCENRGSPHRRLDRERILRNCHD